MAILKIKNENTKEWEDIITIKGDKGDKPTHEVDGTKIRFQNPDGTYGEWIELEVLTADQVPTNDGSNVQSKLDNVYVLGLNEDDNPYIQNDKGSLTLSGKDLDNIKRTNKYYTNICINRPHTSSDGFLDVISINDNYVTQEYTPLTVSVKFKRNCINGVWTSWKLVSDKVLMFQTTLNSYVEGNNTMAISSTIMHMYRHLRLYLYSLSGVAQGWVECIVDDDSEYLSGIDISLPGTSVNTLGMMDVQLRNLGSTIQINICRLTQVNRATGASTTSQLCIRRIEGLS